MGGLENGLVNLINRLPVDEFRHQIICVEDDSDFRERISRDDVEIVSCHRSKIGAMALRRRLYSLFRTARPDVVHSRNLSGLDALLPAVLARVPMRIHGEHGRDVDDVDGTNKSLIRLRRLHRPMVHRYVPVSLDLKNYLVQKIGVAEKKICQIYNGVDIDRFRPSRSNESSSLRSQIDHENPFIIGTVGRLQAVKDQESLIRSFATLRQRGSVDDDRLFLVIAGDGPLRSTLSQLVRELGIEHRVLLLGARDDIPELLRGFDVFVLPSLAEGISNTVLEALASGLPVIATGVGGNPELIVAGECGEIVAPKDLNGFTNAMADYVIDPNRLTAHSTNARLRAEQRFSLPVMIERYGQLYRGVAVDQR